MALPVNGHEGEWVMKIKRIFQGFVGFVLASLALFLFFV